MSGQRRPPGESSVCFRGFKEKREQVMKISGKSLPGNWQAGASSCCIIGTSEGHLQPEKSDGGGRWGQRGLREGRLVQAGPLKDFGFYCRRVGLSLKRFEQRCNLV